MSRFGKIARLPRAVRDTLNCRLHEGDPGPELVAWLNAQPAVQAVLAAHFDGQPINPQNLSDWRQGGYAEWWREQQILALTVTLREEKADLDEEVNGEELAGWFAQASALALAGELRATRAMEEGPAKLRAVLATVRAIDRLQRAQLEAERAKREQPSDDGQLSQIETDRPQPAAKPEPARPALPSPAPVASSPAASRPVVTVRPVSPRPAAPLPFPQRVNPAPTSPPVPAKPGQFVYPWMNGARQGFRALEAIDAIRAA